MSNAAPSPTVAPGTDAPHNTRWALAGLSLSMLLTSLGVSSANVALPVLADTFHTSFQAVQWIVLAYLVTITSLVVVAGRLGDLLGRSRLLLVGLLLFTAASALCGAASSLPVLAVARAIQGVGAALMMALTLALVRGTVPEAQTGRALGLLATMSAIGTALGPSLGGVLIAAISWRAIFFINVPLGVAALLLGVRYLPVDRPARKFTLTDLDGSGTLLLSLAVGTFALGTTAGSGRFGPVNAVLLAAAAMAFAVFVRVEHRSQAPLVALADLRDSGLTSGLAVNTLVSIVMMTTLVVGPFYLANGLGLDAVVVGLVMTTGPMVTALAGLPAGRLVDRFGATELTIPGLLSTGVGCVLLATLPPAAGIPGYVLSMAVVTVGYAVFQTANNSAVLVGSCPDRRGATSGLLTLSRNIGLSIGASLMGAVFAGASGADSAAVASRASVVAGMHVTFGVAVVLIIGAIAIAAARRLGQAAVRPCA